jgi:hypothetical protein
MKRFQRRIPFHLTYVGVILVVILSAVMLGCNSNRAKKMSRGGVTVSYRGGGDITIRARSLVIRLSPPTCAINIAPGEQPGTEPE